MSSGRASGTAPRGTTTAGGCIARQRRGDGSARSGWLRDHGLTVTLLGLFALFLIGQSITGHRDFDADQRAHGEAAVSYLHYLSTGHFFEATFENWESEFLQISAYVALTAFLFQRGSSESKDPDRTEAVDEDPRRAARADSPGPVRRGGLLLRLYEHSLLLLFVLLFVASFIGHAVAGAHEYSGEQREHGEAGVDTIAYVQTSRFWFESFQNWQSEFLAVGSLVLASVWLRQRGSPESKPVAAPHHASGS